MKPFLLFAALTLSAASLQAAARAANLSPRAATPLHFARGATTLVVRGHLSGSQSRFYTLQARAGQSLKIRVSPDTKRELTLVPLLKVTPPRGHYDGDKTALYTSPSSRAGTYRIEIAANLMASGARSGPFILLISAR